MGFYFSKVFEIPIVMQERHVVFHGDDGDQAIVGTARRDASPAPAGIQFGGRGMARCAWPGFQQGKREEMRAQSRKARGISRALENLLDDDRCHRGLH